jgi:hypothetical protein
MENPLAKAARASLATTKPAKMKMNVARISTRNFGPENLYEEHEECKKPALSGLALEVLRSANRAKLTVLY